MTCKAREPRQVLRPQQRIMAAPLLQPLTGFRDFFPEDFARREYLFATWRRVARAFGFVEYDAPVLESLDLFRKKSGGELLGQLFDFTDKGGREVTLRPEMTPSLARMIAARAGRYKKPLKWFSIAPFFRFERTQRGRLREFFQFNADIFGEAGPGAEIELISLAVAIVRALGFDSNQVKVRLGSRDLWAHFLAQQNRSGEDLDALLPVIDKFDFEAPGKTPQPLLDRLASLGLSVDAVVAFAAAPSLEGTPLATLAAGLTDAGCGNAVVIDPRIVRGLAYYTGTVFELFDAGASMRALAGGGRYDHLLRLLSDGAVDLPAIGVAFGDVTLQNLINETAAARARQEAALSAGRTLDCYVVIADESRRSEALGLLHRLREVGIKSAAPLAPLKVGKQFQAAEELGAAHAVVVGAEWPLVNVKTLSDRTERALAHERVPDFLQLPIA